MTHFRSSLLLIGCLAVGACTYRTDPSPPLREMLDGKAGIERKNILTQECLKEAHWWNRIHAGRSPSTEYFTYKALCEEMSAAMEGNNE